MRCTVTAQQGLAVLDVDGGEVTAVQMQMQVTMAVEAVAKGQYPNAFQVGSISDCLGPGQH